jgi:hypothetical protein
VSIIMPLLVTWTMSSIGPNECLFSRRCRANFDLLFPYLKSLKCSWSLVLKGLPVCPVYFILQSGQVSWYMPLLSYLLWSVPCFVVRRLSIVLSVVNVTFTSVFLKSFVMNLCFLPGICELCPLSFLGVWFLFLLSTNFIQGRDFVIVVEQD